MINNTYPLFKIIHNHIFTSYTEGDLVEIGSGPSSSPYLYSIAKECKILLHSVDTQGFRLINPQDKYSKNYCMKGEDFLNSCTHKIFFCYLDNFDWVNYWECPNEPFLTECTKKKSEQTHLDQAQKLIPMLSNKALILFDDTGIEDPVEYPPDLIMRNLPTINFYGKGALAIPFLISQGLRIIGYSANGSHGGINGQHDQILLKHDPMN